MHHLRDTRRGLWIAVALWAASGGAVAPAAAESSPYVGTSSCIDCHAHFYELWSTSHHGLAMQPYTESFAAAELTSQAEAITVGAFHYQAKVGPGEGFVQETGPSGVKQYRIAHVLGGKNVYYFLAPWKGGRLQTLPVSYNVHTRTWYDTARSGVRHFPGLERDEAVHWTDPLYTFNTSCYDCHVSQLDTNYDLATNSYDTHWAEPGINCETCHGPAEEHVRLFQDPNHDPNVLGLISTRVFNQEQMNGLCSTCHAKMSPITASFMPGERFFDHFDLITLENPDFYSDGRDLGENYTMTTWRMAGCLQDPSFTCMHCHTSSGRYRFKERDQAYNACLPCHQDKADHFEQHTHHPPNEPGTPVCTSCHMPMTRFAHMNRSDHSMRPPTPGVSQVFKSDVACLLCHDKRDAAWADRQVRKWHADDYQKPYLERARLLEEARHGNWSHLDGILAYVSSPEREEILATSLVRTLVGCPDERKWPVLVKVLREDRSPLVRAAAADGLDNHFTPAALLALVTATKDDYRLVRVRAASSLASLTPAELPAASRAQVAAATAELKTSFSSRQDDFAAHFNRGNFHMDRREYRAALEAFGKASKLRPDFAPAYVNRAFALNTQGQNAEAETAFRKALALDPNSAVIHMNLGMLLGEMERPDEARQAFLRATQLDPNNAQAAYNLAVLLAETDPALSLAWAKKAHTLRPQDPKYGFTYAFYLARQKRASEAIVVLEHQIDAQVAEVNGYMLLAEIYQSRGQIAEIKDVFQRALANLTLSAEDRAYLQAQIQRLP